jgi:hypothetical protein
MENQRVPIQEEFVRGVNWAPDSCDEEDDYDVSQIVRGDENLAAVGGEEMIGMSESEVRFVADSFVGDTEVSDSQLAKGT